MTADKKPRRILLTGASGYVGGRLLKALETRGYHVRCIARRPEYLIPRVAAQTEVVAGDVLKRDSLRAALDGIDVAFYLVHSMGASEGFEEQDRTGATNFAGAARETGVKRVIVRMSRRCTKQNGQSCRKQHNCRRP